MMPAWPTNSFGQNFNVTMTQLVSGFCSLINGGDYYEPHVIKQIQNENGNVIETKNPVLVKRTVSQETSTMVKDYMRGVVENGSGKKANLEGYEVGGKTGTAEKLPRDNGKYLVSFIGYAPQENPEVVVYVVIDEVNDYDQAQSSYAVQMAADIMKEIFPYLGITTVEGYEPTTDDASTADSTSTDTAVESTTTDSTSTGTATQMVHREVQTVRMKDTNLHQMDTTMVMMGITINMVISIPIKHKKE